MDLYFAGAESPVYLRKLIDLGASHVAISFYEWQRRHSNDDVFKHIPPEMKVCITPGVAKKESIDFERFASDYLEFCEQNADDALIYDLDAPACPPGVRQYVRDQLSILPNVVMFPDDPNELIELATSFERIGVNARMSKSIPGAELRRLPATLYGSNISSQQTLRIGRFHATTSFAWINAKRYGELWVFARGRMHHYSAEKLVKAVRAHRRDIEAFGVDADLCAANDHEALLSVAIRSFQAMAVALSKRPRDRRKPAIADTPADTPSGGTSTSLVVSPDIAPTANGAQPPAERPTDVLPVVSVKAQEDGQIISTSDGSLRQCNSCFISDTCPKYEVDKACAFNFPVEIRTDTQWEAATSTILEWQMERVALLVMAEQVEGTPSPKTGQEMDRFMKLLGGVKDLKRPSISLGSGILAKAFANVQMPSPQPTGVIDDDPEEEDDFVDEEGVFEGEADPAEGEWDLDGAPGEAQEP